MFGNSASPTKEDERGPSPAASVAATADTNASDSKETTNTAAGGEKRNSMSNNSGRNSLEDNNNNNNINHNNNNNSSSSSSSSNAGTEKKRRSSGVAKASALFASAKQSLHLSHASSQAPPQSMAEPHPSAQQSALAKLGKTDAALSVPQGSLNNSAGESHPGPRSTFKVGVTEDKNKKCRRTMEDTHAYLYNFLSTPSPALGSESDSKSDKSGPEPSKLVSATSDITETDNGYFAIFDGHAGTFAADWCGKKLHVLLEEIIRANPNSAIPELLDQTFTTVDQQLQKLPLKNSGCTAICAVLRWEDRIPNPQSATGSTAIAPVAAAVVKASETPNNPNLAPLIPSSISSLPADVNSSTALPRLQETASRQRVLYTANVGDARIVLCRNGKALRLSYDHKGSDENEGRRVTNAGGLILNNRVNGVLAVTRALGDAYMKELVTGHPYTTETVIQPDIDEFLILACDGVSNQPLVATRMLTECSCGTSAATKMQWTSFATPRTLSSRRSSSSTMPLLDSRPTTFRAWWSVSTTRP
jgi:protein phosphatase PTC1